MIRSPDSLNCRDICLSLGVVWKSSYSDGNYREVMSDLNLFVLLDGQNFRMAVLSGGSKISNGSSEWWIIV